MTTYQMQQTSWPQPVTNILPAYLYQQYSDDLNLQAFVDSYNALAQSYLTWFNNTPFAVYTSNYISGSLLDWLAQGIYGISRPVIVSSSTVRLAGYNSRPYDTIGYNRQFISISGTSAVANDDIYKRVMTWILYLGDGRQFNILWLKKRVARFLYGVNGADYPVLDVLPSVSVSGSTFTITIPPVAQAQTFSLLLAAGELPLPFQYTFNVVIT